VSDVRLLLSLARILRAAAEEAERCAQDVPAREPMPKPVKVSELDQARAARVLERLGLR
jgi:hypothetical protein